MEIAAVGMQDVKAFGVDRFWVHHGPGPGASCLPPRSQAMEIVAIWFCVRPGPGLVASGFPPPSQPMEIVDRFGVRHGPGSAPITGFPAPS